MTTPEGGNRLALVLVPLAVSAVLTAIVWGARLDNRVAQVEKRLDAIVALISRRIDRRDE